MMSPKRKGELCKTGERASQMDCVTTGDLGERRVRGTRGSVALGSRIRCVGKVKKRGEGD